MKNPITSMALIAVVLIACSKTTSKDITEKVATTTSSSIIAEGAQLVKLGEGYQFTEGPAVDKQGNVYFTDQPNDRILLWSASDGVITTFLEPAGRSNGTYFDQDGNLIACADMYNQLWSIDMNGKPTVLVESYHDKLLNGPNDVWINPVDGSMYFTDPLYKRPYWERDPETQLDGQHLYYVSPDRQELRIVDENLIKPNGIVGTPDGKHLYVADPGDKKTYLYDIQEGGDLSNRRLFVSMGSDGMTLDNEGNLYITREGVRVFNQQGDQIAHIEVPEGPSNVVFAGPNRKTLFITARKSVYGIKMRVAGVVE